LYSKTVFGKIANILFDMCVEKGLTSQVPVALSISIGSMQFYLLLSTVGKEKRLRLTIQDAPITIDDGKRTQNT
jgi:hypothetical protein